MKIILDIRSDLISENQVLKNQIELVSMALTSPPKKTTFTNEELRTELKKLERRVQKQNSIKPSPPSKLSKSPGAVSKSSDDSPLRKNIINSRRFKMKAEL